MSDKTIKTFEKTYSYQQWDTMPHEDLVADFLKGLFSFCGMDLEIKVWNDPNYQQMHFKAKIEKLEEKR